MLVALRATHENLDLTELDHLTRGSGHLGHVLEQMNATAAAEAKAQAAAGTGGGATSASADLPPLAGWAVVSTCNRLELYLDARRFHDGVDLAARAVAATSGMDVSDVTGRLEVAVGSPVAEHLYEVTSGLRSIVLGEAEIAGQIRTAFEKSREDGDTTPMLNDLFQIGFRHAKRVASETPVGAAGRSGAAIALDLAEQWLGPLGGARVLVIGTGAYSRLSIAELQRRGCAEIRVHSPSGRAWDFAERHGIAEVGPEALADEVAAADLVVACSGRGHSLFPEVFLGAGDTLVLDLALHSDLHPLIRHLAGIDVITLADLTIKVDDTAAPVVAQAQKIIGDGVRQFRFRQQTRRVDPALTALRRTVTAAADDEVAKIRRTHDEATADALERSVRRILAKVMHSPSERARELASSGNAAEVTAAVSTLFGFDLPEESSRGTETQQVADWVPLARTAPIAPASTVLRTPTASAPASAGGEAPASGAPSEPDISPAGRRAQRTGTGPSAD